MELLILELILSFLAGNGLMWFLATKAKVKKEYGQADLEMALAWKILQTVYQTTIVDLLKYAETIKSNLELQAQERDKLRQINDLLREEIGSMREEVLTLRKEVIKNTSQIAQMTPFMCSIIDCPRRKQLSYSDKN